jgi:hypothetical protein
MDSNNKYLESGADIAVRADPTVQNLVVTTEDNNNATLSNISTSHLQDLLATVMTAIQAESSKQTAAFQTEVAKLMETLKMQFRQENEKLAASLTERFEAANAKLREEFNVKLKYEIQGVSERVDTLRRDTEHGINNLTKSVENVSEGVSAIVNAHVVQTRKELDKQGQEIITSLKVVLTSVREHKAETGSTVANLRQVMNQGREHVNNSLSSI